jgi:hypothetical protein
MELPIGDPTEECLPFHRREDEHGPLFVLRVTHCNLIINECDLDAAIRHAASTFLPVGRRKVHRSLQNKGPARPPVLRWTELGWPRQVMGPPPPNRTGSRPERERTRLPGPRDRRMVRPRRPRRSPGGNSHQPTATFSPLLRPRRARRRPQAPWTLGAARRVGAGRGRGGSTCRRRTLPATRRGVEYLPTGMASRRSPLAKQPWALRLLAAELVGAIDEALDRIVRFQCRGTDMVEQ